ncbi:NACHT domain-containing protein [Lyngbya confervoides]|uniref:NACHT conflict system C-terminal helical domain-containing protein n=1 Tax=Lyngbya confervoides BDU141951 TaxID=1574623 RepID=A0ABD4T9B5_9CYAN|nr:hypothetical protein [Lyngbya confervoides]MCM1984865.1 hypothetical protein [Lyngbya confervoides BDU141951]
MNQIIQQFTNDYSQNTIVITCRIAAKEYTFQGFRVVEVADFDEPQIRIFVEKWFQVKQKPQEIARSFFAKLEESQPVKELANSPLLLTLLCLIFEEKGKFPSNRSDLYAEAVDLLLKKWDNSREKERDEIYRGLSSKRRQDLLGKLALETFRNERYFFKRQEAEEIITDSIVNLSGIDPKPDKRDVDSATVLRSIQAQHGLLVERSVNVYSYSHLIFHEYFTAYEIIESHQYGVIATNIFQSRWHEVFRLAVEMLLSRREELDPFLLLVKGSLERKIAGNENTQTILQWIARQAACCKSSYKKAAIRAFYFWLSQLKSSRCRTYALQLSLGIDECLKEQFLPSHRDSKNYNLMLELLLKILSNGFGSETYKACNLGQILNLDQALFLSQRNLSLLRSSLFWPFVCPINAYPDYDFEVMQDLLSIRVRFDKLVDSIAYAMVCASESQDHGLHTILEHLQRELPKIENDDYLGFLDWWTENGDRWTEQLQAAMIQHRNIGHDWNFTEAEIKLLEQYFKANQLLVDCLNSDCSVSPEVRQEIEDTLLLPQKEINRYYAERQQRNA